LLPRFQYRERQEFGGCCVIWDFSLVRSGFGTRWNLCSQEYF
jgi:hypothetical protein